MCVCDCIGATSRSDISPSCDPTSSSRRKAAVLTSQAHRFDVVCEDDRAIQKQQGDVIVIGSWIILGVNYDVWNTSGDLIGIGAFLELFPQIHNQIERIIDAEKKKKKIPCFLFAASLL